ncbi:MAG: cupin domain-containing protein [Caulobacterales bacterium]|nr:cupin domain-containing protein [Caulobacterales bacterium]
MKAPRTMIFAALALLASVASAATERPLAIDPADPALAWSGCPAIFPQGCELSVLHGHPARPNADLLLRVPGGSVLPAHSHTSAERMMLAAGRLSVKYLGAPERVLTGGTYAYGPAGLPHSATCVSEEPCVLFIAFEGPVDANAFAGSLD